MDRRQIAFAFLSLCVAVYLVLSAHQWNNAIRSYEARFQAANDAELAAAKSPGRIFLDNDAYYWISYAQEMADTGKWRIRHTNFDNPPDGRPVHWSQAISWLLLLCGTICHAITGQTVHGAIENAAIWVGPLQHFVLIIATGYLVFKRLGLVPALGWLVNLLTILSIQWSFHPMRPDHHGLHLGFAISGLLCLILGGLGWINPRPVIRDKSRLFSPLQLPDKRVARRFFIASGILGGLGIWTGASVQLFGIGLFAASAFLMILCMPSHISAQHGDAADYDSSLWRWWAMTGAATSLIFYLIEYAPSFPGMRLEVNHPLYAVSWICIGELLTRLSAGKMSARPQNYFLTALLGAGALLLPALLFFGPSEWHVARDPQMRRLHQFIDEFHPYLSAFPGSPWRNVLKDVGLLPLFLVFAPFLANEKRTTLGEWAALWMAFVPALAYAALTLSQARWLNFFCASSLLLAVVVLAILWRHQVEKGRVAVWFCVLAAALVVQPIYFLNFQRKDIIWRDISRERIGELIGPMLQRQFAEKLGARDSNHVFRVMGGPHMAARLYYFGHVPNIASYYWENLQGLRSASEFFAATDDEVARRVVQERGITHVVVPPSVDNARVFYFVKNGVFSDSGARDSLAGRLLLRPESLPRWIKRDVSLERSLQRGYIFNGEPVFGTLLVFTIQQDQLSAGANKP